MQLLGLREVHFDQKKAFASRKYRLTTKYFTVMSLYRLSITELTSTLEVVVELPDTFVEKYFADFINRRMNEAADCKNFAAIG